MITFADLLDLANWLLFYPCGLRLSVRVVEHGGEILDAFWAIEDLRTGVMKRV